MNEFIRNREIESILKVIVVRDSRTQPRHRCPRDIDSCQSLLVTSPYEWPFCERASLRVFTLRIGIHLQSLIPWHRQSLFYVTEGYSILFEQGISARFTRVYSLCTWPTGDNGVPSKRLTPRWMIAHTKERIYPVGTEVPVILWVSWS